MGWIELEHCTALYGTALHCTASVMVPLSSGGTKSIKDLVVRCWLTQQDNCSQFITGGGGEGRGWMTCMVAA